MSVREELRVEVEVKVATRRSVSVTEERMMSVDWYAILVYESFASLVLQCIWLYGVLPSTLLPHLIEQSSGLSQSNRNSPVNSTANHSNKGKGRHP